MSALLIFGPAGSGKTSQAVNEFIEAADTGKNPIFIAPSGPDALHFQRRILSLQDPLPGGEVTTFATLCRRLLYTANPSLNVLAASDQLNLIRSVVEAAGNLQAIEGSAGYEGSIRALAELISELELLDISPEEMAKRLTPWAASKWRRSLTSDLFRIYQEYRATLMHLSVCDDGMAQGRVLKYIQEVPVFPHSPVIIDGFWDFTPMQHKLIEAISGKAEVIVTIPAEPGRQAYTATCRSLESFSRAGRNRLYRQDRCASAALKHVNNNLFEEQADPAPLGTVADDVVIFEAAGTRGQAEMIAAEILKLFRQGIDLDDIAVISRSVDRNLFDVAATLDRFGVPFELPYPLPLSRTPVGRAAIAALDFVTGDGDDSVAALLSFLNCGLSPEIPEEVDRFNQRIKINAIQKRSKLLREWEKTTGRPIVGLEKLLTSAKEAPESLGSDIYCLVASMVSQKISRDGTGAEVSSKYLLALKELQSCCQGASRCLDAVKDIVTLIHDEESFFNLPRVTKSLRQAINTAAVREAAGRRRKCVRLLDPHRALNQHFDVVFICGVLEKQFPNLGREDPFFSDRDRRELAEIYGLPLKNRDGRLDEERFLFHRSISRARKKLFICYPYCDQDGRPTVRSLFVDDLIDLFAKDPLKEAGLIRQQKKLSEVVFPVSQAPSPEQALIALALASSSLDRDAVIAAAAPLGLAGRMRSCLEASASQARGLKELTIKNHFAVMDEFVITGLQKYLQCPFRYFVESVLKPADMDPIAHGLRRGKVAHNILYRFGEIMKRLNISLSGAADEQVIELKRQMQLLIDEELPGQDGDMKTTILRNELSFHLDRFVDRESESGRRFTIFDVELSFGDNRKTKLGGRHSTSEMLNLNGIKLKGRIDRIDWTGNSEEAIVIDYKTSKSATSQTNFEKCKEIQIPLYMQALSIFGLKPVGGEYYALRGEKRAGLYLADFAGILGEGCSEVNKKDFVEPAIFKERLSRAKVFVLEAVKGIRSGSFSPDPLAEACKYCGLEVICRRGEIESQTMSEDY